MATTKNTRATHQHAKVALGLLANGSSGPWDVAIDATTSGPDRWYAQIEGPLATFYFQVPSLGIVSEMVQFLQPSSRAARRPSNGVAEPSGRLVIGKDKKAAVTLIRDDEYSDRFFLTIGPAENPTVRFIIAGADVGHLANALCQVDEDLQDDD
jgi:hypothetical protein